METTWTTGTPLDIRYTNGAGEASTRRIHVRHTYTHGGTTYVVAWCELRREERVFRADRIVVLSAAPSRNAPRPAAAAPSRTLSSTAPASSPNEVPGRLLSTIVVALVIVILSAAATETRWVSHNVDRVAELIEASGYRQERAERDERARGEERAEHAERDEGAQREDAADTEVAATRTVEPVRYQRTARHDEFVRKTGIDDQILVRVYQNADSNGNDILEWHEIKQFQSWVYRSFRYEFNATALPPDQFGARGGGDCEDFALYTCGLMSYWGYDCWIGNYAGNASNDWTDHAVALLAVEDHPVGMDSFEIAAHTNVAWRAQGRRVVPIDYDQVGGYTNATPRPLNLTHVYEPRHIYGWYM